MWSEKQLSATGNVIGNKARMNKTKRNISLLSLAVIIGAAYLLWHGQNGQHPEEQALEQSTESTSESLVGTEAELIAEFEEAEQDPLEPPFAQQQTQPLGEVETRSIRKRLNEQEPLPHDVPLDRFKASLWAEIQKNPPDIPDRGDPDVDAELAYQTYLFYGNCSIAPRTASNLDYRLKQITSRSDGRDERYLERMERAAEQAFSFYELCLAIPPDVDARLEAVNWMGEAVRLGHEIAEVQYYEKAMGFLLRRDRWQNSPPIAMMYSGLIQEFKSTARFALSRALEKGHPEAYLAMSQAHIDGVIFQIDPVLAMAYVRVAELESMENRSIDARIARQKDRVSEQLSPDQLAEADELANRLRLGESV